MIKALFASAALLLAVPAVAAEPVRGVTDSEIIIGSYTDLSGVTAMWGVNNSNSWRMVFDEVNAVSVTISAFRRTRKNCCIAK